MADPVMVPVGYPAGVHHGAGEAFGLVRVAERYYSLPVSEYATWMLCWAVGPRSEILREATNVGLANTGRVLAELQEQGLLVVMAGDLTADRAVLENLRLQMVGFGLGNTNDEQARLRFGTFGHGPTIEVDATLYALLLRSVGESSIWQLCADAAEELEAPTAELATRLVDAIPRLLSTFSAFLDRPR
jgi:hypothetical protein